MTQTTTHDVPRADGTRLLVVWDGGSVALEIPPEGELVLGRGDDADIQVNHGSVSRKHAVLRLGATPTIEDLGSANGTWIEGIRLTQGSPVPVKPNVAVELGSAILMVRRGGASPSEDDAAMVVVDAEMQRVHELLDVAARSTLPIVLLGETGVGKEVLATRVHHASPRAKKPFLKLNCAALVESLLESELFGHEKGAFTGASATKQGLLEAADGGTLFLDELGEMPLSTQAKLLRVLETGEVTRIGAVRPRTIDVRLVCATNRDLLAFTREGRFRQDLYYRLDGVTVHVPPLRARGEEVIALAQAFLREAGAKSGRVIAFGEDALAALRTHSWPGNVRELRNVIARSVLFATGPLLRAAEIRFDGIGQTRPESVPPPPRVPRDAPTIVPPPPLPRRGKLDPEEERQRVIRALEQCAGNQTRAAELLGIGRRTLLNRLDALGIQRPRKAVDGDPET